jgi:hypothetical protein
MKQDIVSTFEKINDENICHKYIKTCNHTIDTSKNSRFSVYLNKENKCCYRNFRIIGLNDVEKELKCVEILYGGFAINRFCPNQKDFITKTINGSNDIEYIPSTISYTGLSVNYTYSNIKMLGYQIPLINFIGGTNLLYHEMYKFEIMLEFKNINNSVTIEYDTYERL